MLAPPVNVTFAAEAVAEVAFILRVIVEFIIFEVAIAVDIFIEVVIIEVVIGFVVTTPMEVDSFRVEVDSFRVEVDSLRVVVLSFNVLIIVVMGVVWKWRLGDVTSVLPS